MTRRILHVARCRTVGVTVGGAETRATVAVGVHLQFSEAPHARSSIPLPTTGYEDALYAQPDEQSHGLGLKRKM